MKILVGTLFSGENEMDECVEAINNQTYTDFTHIIIKDLPQLEAHAQLYRTFMSRTDQYQLLVKVDADTVILSADLFKNIVEKFSLDEWLDVMNIGVMDFFTGKIIPAGIQIYRNNVTWNLDKDTGFPDIPEMRPENYLYDKTTLAPAAIHCKNPSKYQAFHYGVHRGIKSIQRIYSTSHWSLLQSVWENFKKTRDVRIGLAILGAELVYIGKFKKEDADYTNPKMKALLEKYKNMDAGKIEGEIRKMRFMNWGCLPGDLRRRLIRKIRGIYFPNDHR